MKKKKYMMILLLVFTMLATGCTTYLKDENKKPVQNEVTGQNLVENILCQPESEETRAIYEKHNMDLNKLRPRNFPFTTTASANANTSCGTATIMYQIQFLKVLIYCDSVKIR